MADLKIIRATNHDFNDVANILTAAFHYKLDHGDTSWGKDRTEVFSIEEVSKQMSEGEVYIAKLNDEPIGTATLQWEDLRIWGDQKSKAGYLHRLAIKDGYRGKGIGKQLVEHLSEQITKKGYKYLRLDCIADNKRLCAYYEQLGFIRIKVVEMQGYSAALYELEI